MAKPKKITLGSETYDLCDAAATQAAATAKETADLKVATINGYAQTAIEAQTVTFANKALDQTEIENAVLNIGK
jgi:hypothetical protein